MFKTSTIYIKAQTPGISMQALLDLYKQELKYQSVTHIEVNNDNINFSDKFFKIIDRGQPNRFGNFSKGRITIEETEHEYIVTLSADMSRLLKRAGIGTCIVTLFLMICGISYRPVMLFGFFIFLLIIGLPYVLTIVFFPDYFTALRNKFERVIKNPKSQS
jgi:hypothetical protein